MPDKNQNSTQVFAGWRSFADTHGRVDGALYDFPILFEDDYTGRGHGHRVPATKAFLKFISQYALVALVDG